MFSARVKKDEMITNHRSEVSSFTDIFTTLNILRGFDGSISLTHILMAFWIMITFYTLLTSLFCT
jgi:hypothetical protein